MTPLEEMFCTLAAKLQQGSRASSVVCPETVFQTANFENRKHVHALLDKLMLPESRIENYQALQQLSDLSAQGKSCLILAEHYSNFDIPDLFLIMERMGPDVEAISNRIIPIAGVKLNEEGSFVRAFAETYSRLLTYPPRSMDVLRQDPDMNAEEITRAKAINMAALHELVRLKHSGHMILVYPSGTRYRPENEDTRRGLKEMDSYMKSFDSVLFLGMAGNTLRINPTGEHMGYDLPQKDAVIFVASDVVDARAFRTEIRGASTDEDSKQAVADAVMARLAVLHEQAAAIHADVMSACSPVTAATLE
jgi:glycerol-3-phosphate O-acyltransferase